MEAIKYLKMDTILMKDSFKYFLTFPLMLIFLIHQGSTLFAIGYMFFILIYLAPYPFNIEHTERSRVFYASLPGKKKSMIFGRYLYLFLATLWVWAIAIVVMRYLTSTESISMVEVWIGIISGVGATLMCFALYPLYYRFGMEKSKIMFLGIPAMIAFAFPLIFSSDRGWDIFTRVMDNFMERTVFTGMILMLIILAGAFLSYKISCRIVMKNSLGS